MVALNRTAAEVFRNHEIHACTDITGFGLIGHCLEMAEGSRVTLQLFSNRVPFITDAEDYAEMGLIPAGTYRNRDHAKGKVLADGIGDSRMDLMYDPQTSGGLLAAVPETEAPDILRELRGRLKTKCGLIGTVLPEAEHRIIVT